MIRNWDLQCLECPDCGEQIPIKRKLLRDQDAMLELVDEQRYVHKRCKELAGDPARAKLEREYRVRMRCEVRRSSR